MLDYIETEILSALECAESAVSDLPKELERVSGLGPIELTRAFVTVRQLKDRVEEVIKPLNAIYEKLKTEGVPQAFESAGVPTINLDEGYRITVSHLVRASIKGGRKEEAYQWLRENQLGDLVTETVNASTLSAVSRSMQEENRELPEDLFSVAILPTTSVTKVK